MMHRKEWEEFRDTGLLWWINMILHTFGWAIVVSVDDEGVVKNVFPARVTFRGFDETDNDKGYWRVSKYLLNNCEELEEEAFHNELINRRTDDDLE